MKKYLYGILALMVSLSASVSLSSCGDDDEDAVGDSVSNNTGGGSTSNNAGVVDKNLGIRITGYAGWLYYYSEDGRLSKISNGYDSYIFYYSPNKIVRFSVSDDDGDNEETNVSYNAAGYITGFSSSGNGTDGDEKWSYTSNASLSYDGSGHLTKIASSYSGNSSDSEGSWSESGNATYSLSWTSNRLASFKGVSKYKDEDGAYSTSFSIIYSYNNATENPLHQWAPSLAYYLAEEDEGSLEELLAYAGLFGTGPAELPSAMTYESTDEDGKTYEGSDSFANANGSLATARVQNNTVRFSYDYLTNDSVNASKAMLKPVKAIKGGLLLHKHNRK